MSYGAIMIDLPKTQDALREPEVWNEKWERLCAQGVFTPSIIFEHERGKDRLRALSSLADMYHQHLESTLELRTVVSKRYVYLGDEFEEGWKNASREVRRHHALFAISQSCSVARNLNDARAHTFDVLTLSNLSDDGQTVVDLLRDLLPDDLTSFCRDLHYFPDAPWDNFKAEKLRTDSFSEKDKLTLELLLVLRTKLIYYVLQNLFMSFLGKFDDLPTIRVQKNHDKLQVDPREQKLAKEMIKQALGREAASQQFKEDRAAAKDRKAKRIIACHSTGCGKEEKEGERYMRCSKCWDQVQRSISYCSKECQVADWKDKHKRICGKPFDFDAAKAAATLSNIYNAGPGQIGPAINGFKRSPALLFHIKLLNEDPTKDLYVKVKPGPAATSGKSYIGIDTPFSPIQSRVRAARDKGMTTGDRESIARVCQYTFWFLLAKHYDDSHGFDMEAILDQWIKEFEFPTLKEEMIKLQDSQFADPHKRPPLMQDLNLMAWNSYIQAGPVDFSVRIS